MLPEGSSARPPPPRDSVSDRGRESECSPSLRTGLAVFQRPALQLMGSTVRLRASRFRDRLLALSALYASCGQVEQPGLVKEAVAPSGVIVNSFGLPFSFGSLSQDASQSSSDPTVHVLEGIEFAVLEVVTTSPHILGSWVDLDTISCIRRSIF